MIKNPQMVHTVTDDAPLGMYCERAWKRLEWLYQLKNWTAWISLFG